MEIKLKIGEEEFIQKSFLPPEKIIGANSSWYVLQNGIPGIFGCGENIVINADSYIIGKKEYTLTDKFGIQAIVKDKHVYILCRAAKGKERLVLKTKKSNRFETIEEGPDNYLWPIIVKIEEC